MTTITIKQHGDVVFFLESSGFKKGWIKTTRVISEKGKKLDIIYFVTSKDYAEIFIGYEKKPSEVWDSYDKMLSYFEANFPK